jgi:DNA (cytosine-5)-methyltransferase 1
VTFGSFCSGIGAPETAWHGLGWSSAFVSEIEPFPCAVLAQRFPGVPNLGDMTKITTDDLERHGPVDLLVAGTPCQSFSVAGLRAGLADPRGNLALEFLRLVDAARPRWVVWENVPGVLSSSGGRDFGAFLGGLGQLGYGWAYRVLDAQFVRVESHPRAVPQRRRRVFVVGCFGSWQRAAAVLLERQSLCGHPAPRREAGAGVAALTANGVGTCGADDNQAQAGHLIGSGVNNFGERDTATALSTKNQRLDGDTETFVVAHSLTRRYDDSSEDGCGRGVPLVPIAFSSTGGAGGGIETDGICQTLGVGMGEPAIAFAQNQRDEVRVLPGVAGACAAEPGMKQQTYIAFDTTQITSKSNYSSPKPGEPCHPLAAGAHPPAVAFTQNQAGDVLTGPVSASMGTNCNATGRNTPKVMTFQERGRDGGRACEVIEDVAYSLTAPSGGWRSQERNIASGMTVRRLTPTECERLQGFPDGHTAIDYRGKPAADGPRYKALGNSMAVNVMAWVGQRIKCIDDSVAELGSFSSSRDES